MPRLRPRRTEPRPLSTRLWKSSFKKSIGRNGVLESNFLLTAEKEPMIDGIKFVGNGDAAGDSRLNELAIPRSALVTPDGADPEESARASNDPCI